MRHVRQLSLASALSAVVLVAGGTAAVATPKAQQEQGNAGFTIAAVRAQRTGAAGALRAVAGGPDARGLAWMSTTDGQSALVDASLVERGVVSAAAPAFVDLSWDAASAGARYAVLRDGQRIATTAPGASFFRDLGVTPGSVHRYGIVPVGATGDRSWGLKVSVPTASGPSGLRTAALATTEDASGTSAGAVQAGVGSTSTVTWMTFIPQSRLDAPTIAGRAVCTYGTGYQFGGDGHGFDWRSSSYRTAVSAVVDWRSKTVTGHTAIGTTHVYDKKTGRLVAERTASGAKTYAKKLGSGSTYVDVRMVTHAGNPFCSSAAGAIDGAFSISLTQSGNYSIFSGNHRQMPNHHVYIYDQGVATDVYRLTYANPYCLFGAATCELARFSGAGSF